MQTKQTLSFIDLDDLSVELRINKRLKHSYISVSKDLRVVLKTPSQSRSFALDLLSSRRKWIDKKLAELRSKPPRRRRCDELNLSEAREYLPHRLDHFAQVMDLEYSKLNIKLLKSRWGSCNSRGEIVLNARLMELKTTQIDYVIVHELAHLVHMNHSKEFHALISRFIEDHRSVARSIR
ncbi:MAG: M48 family metallopeptidase [Sulfuricurvum sp.]